MNIKSFLMILIISIFVLSLVAGAYGKEAKLKPDKINKIDSQLEKNIKSAPKAKYNIIIEYSDIPVLNNEQNIDKRKGVVKKRFKAEPIKKLIAAEINGEEIEKLLKDDGKIKIIYPDYEVKLVLDKSVPLIQAPSVWQKYGLTGKGVKVAVIDTGVADHPALAGRIKQHLSFNSEPPGDLHGHGTHVAGIIASNDQTYKGVAPDADIYDLKVLGSNGIGSFSNILSAIEWAVNNNMNVMSMSFGAYIYCDGNDAVSQMIDYAATKGVISVVAAGNYGPSSYTLTAPGCARQAITVGSTDKADGISYFSSRGPTDDGRQKPEIVAPGSSITSTWNNNGFISASGTSMATPHISGVVALMIADQSQLSRSKILETFEKTSKSLGLDFNTQGYGRVEALKSIEYLHPTDTIPPAISNIIISPSPAGKQAVKIEFDVSEALKANPEVLVNSKTAGYSSLNSLRYSYNYQVLETDQQGVATITIKATDNSNNVGTKTSQDLVIDTVPPSEASIFINNNDDSTARSIVNLSLFARDETTGINSIALSNDGLTFTSPEEYKTTKSWTLSEGTGKKTVHAKFIDKTGNNKIVFDEINYVEKPECSIDTDCPQDFICKDSKCIPKEPEKKCLLDKDCPEGNECIEGVCVPKQKEYKCDKLKERVEEVYKKRLNDINDWHEKQLKQLEKWCKDLPPVTPPTPAPVPPQPPVTPPQPPTTPGETILPSIRYYETPKTWDFNVANGATSVEVTTYLADNLNRIDAYGGWTGYININGKRIWQNTPNITTDYTTGKTYPVNAGYGLGKWINVINYVSPGKNNVTYYHFNEGPGMGVKIKLTANAQRLTGYAGFNLFTGMASQIVLPAIKFSQAPKTFQFDVPKEFSKIEVTTFLADKPDRLDAYGGWNAYMDVNGKRIWTNNPSTTTDYTTGKTYSVNAGYGRDRWLDVTKYVKQGKNAITYFHYTEGSGMGVKVRVTTASIIPATPKPTTTKPSQLKTEIKPAVPITAIPSKIDKTITPSVKKETAIPAQAISKVNETPVKKLTAEQLAIEEYEKRGAEVPFVPANIAEIYGKKLSEGGWVCSWIADKNDYYERLYRDVNLGAPYYINEKKCDKMCDFVTGRCQTTALEQQPAPTIIPKETPKVFKEGWLCTISNNKQYYFERYQTTQGSWEQAKECKYSCNEDTQRCKQAPVESAVETSQETCEIKWKCAPDNAFKFKIGTDCNVAEKFACSSGCKDGECLAKPSPEKCIPKGECRGNTAVFTGADCKTIEEKQCEGMCEEGKCVFKEGNFCYDNKRIAYRYKDGRVIKGSECPEQCVDNQCKCTEKQVCLGKNLIGIRTTDCKQKDVRGCDEGCDFDHNKCFEKPLNYCDTKEKQKIIHKDKYGKESYEYCSSGFVCSKGECTNKCSTTGWQCEGNAEKQYDKACNIISSKGCGDYTCNSYTGKCFNCKPGYTCRQDSQGSYRIWQMAYCEGEEKSGCQCKTDSSTKTYCPAGCENGRCIASIPSQTTKQQIITPKTAPTQNVVQQAITGCEYQGKNYNIGASICTKEGNTMFSKTCGSTGYWSSMSCTSGVCIESKGKCRASWCTWWDINVMPHQDCV